MAVAMTSEADVLRLVASRLQAAGIPYMLSGSMAFNFYTTPRMTRDIDIVVELQSAGVEKLLQTFRPDFYIDAEMIRGALEHCLPFNIIHLASVTKVDLIPHKQTEYQRSTFQRMMSLQFGGEQISVISPEDLIISKLLWAKDSLSEVQLRDVKKLLETCPDLDMNYMEQWVNQLGLTKPFSLAKE